MLNPNVSNFARMWHVLMYLSLGFGVKEEDLTSHSAYYNRVSINDNLRYAIGIVEVAQQNDRRVYEWRLSL